MFVVVDCELVSILCGVLETVFLFVVVDCELVSILCGVLETVFCLLLLIASLFPFCVVC